MAAKSSSSAKGKVISSKTTGPAVRGGKGKMFGKQSVKAGKAK
jgi:hypothetical protein